MCISKKNKIIKKKERVKKLMYIYIYDLNNI